MALSNILSRSWLAPLVPIIILAISWFLVNSPSFLANSEALSLGLTIDMAILAPLLYFIAISRTNIPKVTVIPVFVLSLVFATFVLPVEYQTHLTWIKTWIVPVVELGVISALIYSVIRINRELKVQQLESPDFYQSMTLASRKLLPPRISELFSAEISTFYYGLFSWKKRRLKTNEFSYHRESSGMTILIAILCIIPIETFVFHLLIQKWSVVAAWIFSGIGIYSGFQLLGITRSLTKRPIKVTEEKILLTYGIFQEAEISVDQVKEIEYSGREIDQGEDVRKLSLLGNMESHNVILHLREEGMLHGLWGIKRKFNSIAFHVDELERFKNSLT